MFDALNHEIGLSTRSTSPAGTNGRATPMAANYALCEMDLPAGENYCVGSPYINLTNESYYFNYNSNSVHFITRTKGDGTCEVVYFGCLGLSAEPQHYIADWRVFMRRELVCPNRDGKYLVWTDGTDFGIGHMDVEASIATNNFTTPFFTNCSPNPCDYVKLCVPEICNCIQADFILLPSSEIGLSNNLLDRGFKFMVKHVYYDGRESEWSPWSILYYQKTQSCFGGNAGLSRCMKLRIPLGNAMVEKVKVAFSEDGGLTWFICETVEKYKKYNDLQQKWYERELAELQGYSAEDCSFDYIFCNNKERVQVPSTEYNRVRNPIPREAQGFFQIKDSIAVYNYKDGVCPIDKKEVEKIQLSLNCPDAQNQCNPVFVTVTVRAIIHTLPGSANRYIFRYNGGTIYADDDVTDPAFYGGTGYPFQTSMSKNFGQTFTAKTRGFIPYVDGYDYWAETVQWQSDPFYHNMKKVGVIGNQGDNASLDAINIIIRTGVFFYSEAKIKVLKGTKGFLRLSNQSNTVGTGDAQNTSTSVYGILDDIHNYTGINMPTSHFDRSRKEIFFDTCNGDVDLTEAFIILDLADQDPIFHSIETTSYAGYIRDKNNNPCEGLVLRFTYTDGDNAGQTVELGTTDHNGYYAFSISDADIAAVDIYGELSCFGLTKLQTMTLAGAKGHTLIHDEIITSDLYAINYFLNLKQRVVDCSGEPVAGIKISVFGSKSKTTDADGVATLRLRNYSTRNRILHTVVVNQGGCFTLDCDNRCNPCMPDNIETSIPCYFGTPAYTMPDLEVNRNSLLSLANGLKAGGRYPMAAQASGDCGLLSAAYLIKYIDIPKSQDKNGLSFCSFKVDFGDAVFPSHFNCLKILRGANENPYELQWVVDKKEYTGDGKIKLTIQSLNDYNQKYFFQTNTVYQWTKGDRVEFIRNGDGSILSIATNGLLNYLTISPFHDTLVSGQPNADAHYFNQLIIEDDNRLANVTEGAIIEIQRPKNSVGETILYDICVSIPLVDGIPTIQEITFTTFDTYIVTRTSGNFLGYFESKYPSDFWGRYLGSDGIPLPFDDTGKRYILNPYETEKRYGRYISLNSPTRFNYFGDIIKRVEAPEHGDITAAHITDAQIIMFISEHDNLIAQSSDDLARVGSDGILRALPADAVISKGQPKVRGEFGCQYDSIGSVIFGDGFAIWVDKNKDAHVKHDFNEAIDVSLGRTQNFWRKKCQEMAFVNSNTSEPLNKLRFIAGQNQLNGAVMTTIKTLRQPGTNNAFDPYSIQNVTLSYHPVADIYLTRTAFTPESYSRINLSDEQGCAFISVIHGIPFVHPKISDRFLEFYGITCDWIFGQTMNLDVKKDKTALAFEVQSTTKWFVAKVTTENPNFISEIPARRVKRSLNKWNGAFLNNANSRGGLYGGTADVARGYYVECLFVRDNTIADVYGSLDNEKRQKYSEVGHLFFKFKTNESAGYTENL